jgi:hypothetical protein
MRYYFRLYQLEEDDARRTQLIRRAHEICSETTDDTNTNGNSDWDEPGMSNIRQQFDVLYVVVRR